MQGLCNNQDIANICWAVAEGRFTQLQAPVLHAAACALQVGTRVEAGGEEWVQGGLAWRACSHAPSGIVLVAGSTRSIASALWGEVLHLVT